MSERAHHGHSQENLASESKERHEQVNNETGLSRPEYSSSAESSHGHSPEKSNDDIAELKRSAEALSLASKEITVDTPESSHDSYEPSTNYINKELRTMALQRTMIRVRKQLNPADKLLSRVVHNQAIDKLSEVGSVTVARPSGLLGGGLLAAIGTTIYYFLARRYGYEYNFSVFIILVAAGFILGIGFEFAAKMLGRKSN